jgi:hypothetical protein
VPGAKFPSGYKTFLGYRGGGYRTVEMLVIAEWLYLLGAEEE